MPKQSPITAIFPSVHWDSITEASSKEVRSLELLDQSGFPTKIRSFPSQLQKKHQWRNKLKKNVSQAFINNMSMSVTLCVCLCGGVLLRENAHGLHGRETSGPTSTHTHTQQSAKFGHDLAIKSQLEGPPQCMSITRQGVIEIGAKYR